MQHRIDRVLSDPALAIVHRGPQQITLCRRQTQRHRSLPKEAIRHPLEPSIQSGSTPRERHHPPRGLEPLTPCLQTDSKQGDSASDLHKRETRVDTFPLEWPFLPPTVPL